MRLLFHEPQKITVVNNRYAPQNGGICPAGIPPGYQVTGQ